MALRSFSTLVTLCLAASAVPGQLTGFDTFVWTSTGPTLVNSFVGPEVMQIQGPDGLGCPGGADTTFSATATYAATLRVLVDWAGSGPCGGDAPYYHVNGQPVLIGDLGGGCVPDGSAQIVFEVQAGDAFGFGVTSFDCSGGPGVAMFHDLNVQPNLWVDLGGRLDPRQHLQYQGSAPSHEFAAAVARCGDADLDGVGDVAIGAPGQGNGTVHLRDSIHGLPIWNVTLGGRAGSALAGLPDVNGDGRDEVVVGAPGDGRVYVLSGLDGSVIWSHPGSPLLQTGAAVATIGDVSGDGLSEVVVGQPDDSVTLGAPVLVLSGADGALVRTLIPDPNDRRFGSAVAAAGDVDDDGWPDVAVGAPGVGVNGPAVRVYSGTTGLPILQVAPVGGAADPSFGLAVATAGDRNGDGHDEIVVGAPSEVPLAGSEALGAVTLYDGDTGAPLQTWWGSQDGARFGSSLAGALDVDVDGWPDVLAGAPGHDQPGKPDCGLVAQLRPADGALVRNFTGDKAGDGLGGAVAFLGDGGGGRLPSVLLAAPTADNGKLVALTDLNHPGGEPTLTGSGSQLPNEPFAVVASQALPHTTVVLVLGLFPLFAPFKGGTLVPTPDGLFFLGSDGSGTMTLPSLWPVGLPYEFPLYMQAWIQDPAGPVGWAATNGLATIVP